MTTKECVNYYHSLLKFGIKPGLERIIKLLEILDNPQKDLKFIHIAGTNGKGSVAIMLSNIFREAGYKTGLYISPYITDFRERIQINNELISEDILSGATVKVKEAIENLNKNGETITEFEAVTAAAFLCYKQAKCDIVILETGLGGRFDATNVIDEPLISIITSISLDHTSILGDTYEKIAFEKCGIIKPHCPVAVPSTLPKAAMDTVEKICKERACRLIYAEKSKITVSNKTLNGFTEYYNGLTFKVPLSGEKQSENAALCVSVVKNCSDFSIKDSDIIKGIESSVNPARLELINENPVIILDGSHNDASTEMLADFLKEQLPNKEIVALMGMMADKEIDKVLNNLLPLFSEVITTVPSNPRAIDSEKLSSLIKEKNVKAVSIPNPEEAVKYAVNKIVNTDKALVACGSLYLAGDIRNFLANTVDELF